MTRRLAIAAAALLLLPASAGAEPQRGVTYSGGTLGPVYSPPDHLDAATVQVRPREDGRTVSFRVSGAARCPDGSVEPFLRVASVPLSGRRFSGTVAGGQGPVTISGRFSGDRVVIGRFSARPTRTLEDGTTAPCDTGPVPWQARAAGLPGGSASLAGNRLYFGSTLTGLPFVLRTAADARRVAQLTLDYRSVCTISAPVTTGYVFPSGPIGRRGRFEVTERVSVDEGENVRDYFATAQGVFGQRLRGTALIRETVRSEATGAVVETCDSGVIRFVAVR